MGIRRRSRPRRRLRRVILLAGTVSGVGALRTLLLARNERRYSHLITQRSSR